MRFRLFFINIFFLAFFFCTFSCKTNYDINVDIAQNYYKFLKTISNDGKVIIGDYLKMELSKNNANIIIQKDKKSYNIIGQLKPERENRIVVGTFYDIENQENLGAIALVLSLSKIVEFSKQNQYGLDIVFFDNHYFQSSGAKLFAVNSKTDINKCVYIQNILGKELSYLIDENSHKNSYQLVEEIWSAAFDLGFNDLSSQIETYKSDQITLNSYNIKTVLLTNSNYSKFDKRSGYVFSHFQELIQEVINE
ncbi:MAG: hypothetical protein U9N34_00210 [Candidatus Cloacimonadota bacterium]|nr:hypothetical protein [Candidatus Cloacimonadota bacterium]